MENSLVTTSPAPISKPLDTPSTEAIREFLVKAGEVYSRVITATLIAIWQRELGHIDEIALLAAMSKVLRECRFFPTIADVWKSIPVFDKCEREHSTVPRPRSRCRLRHYANPPECEKCRSTGWRLNEENQATLCECRILPETQEGTYDPAEDSDIRN